MKATLSIQVSPASSPAVDLVAAGDFCLRTPAAQRALLDGVERLLAPELLSVCWAKDLSMVNLECPLAKLQEATIKSGPALCGAPELVQSLRFAGFDIAVMANNHIMDHGPDSMFATRRSCEDAGLRTVGVGATEGEAKAPLLLEVNGLKLAVLAFAEQEFSCAGPVTPGAARLDPVLSGRCVTQAKRAADLVVVNVHGGTEFYFAPSPRVQSWYRFLVDCGADAVIGHHPHTVQGMEVYEGAPIFYSLGNFVFDASGQMPDCWYQGLLAKLSLGRSGAQSIELYATTQREGASGLVVGETNGVGHERFRERLTRLNEISSDDRLLRDLWHCSCYDRRGDYTSRLLTGCGLTRPELTRLIKLGVKWAAPHLFGAALMGALGRFMTPKRVEQRGITILCNALRCPAHHETLTTILEMELEGQRPRTDAWAEYQKLITECR